MNQHRLNKGEIQEIVGLINHVNAQFSSVEEGAFQNEAGLLAHDLPRTVRAFFHRFKMFEENAGVLLLSGFPVDDVAIGKTPSHWRLKNVTATAPMDTFFVLCGFLLGDPISWATQQDGFLLHEVIPIAKYESEQLSFSSQQYLEWHTEDAFHPYRPDFVGLMCLRNPTRTSTRIASMAHVRLDPEVLKELMKPKFTIRPDKSHFKVNRIRANPDNPWDLTASYQRIEAMNTQPDPVPVLFGHEDAPYVRIDPYFMETPKDEKARAALEILEKELEKNLVDLVLKPGDLLFLDNYQVVHGRHPFVAKYDGTDRWMKRINIVKDLRKSRELRASVSSRKIN